MVKRRWPWDVLGMERTDDKGAIRRAYAERLKAMDLDADVGGYADLRHARDEALRQAPRGEGHEAPVLADEIDEAEPDLAHYDNGDGLDDDFAITWDDIQPGPGGDFGYGTGEFADPDTAIADEAAPGHDRALAQLLYPGGEYSDAAFTHEEYAAAQAALDALLVEAHGGDLGREQAIDHWLAELLAETWPRSAPLVEQTSAAFDWPALSGQIGERAALQFLNPRLRGMRFVEKVEQPGHPLYKAWGELRRPGKRNLIDMLRVKRGDVETLLGGIRTRYPEVESYLDAGRVASWEKEAPGWLRWATQRIFIFIAVFGLLSFCGRMIDDVAIPLSQLDAIAEETFGEGRKMAHVQMAAPDLYDLLYEGIDNALDRGDTAEQAATQTVERVRQLTALALEDAPRSELLAIAAVRKQLFEVAAEGGTPACLAFITEARLPDVGGLPEGLRDAERALAWRLAQADLLDPNYSAQEEQRLALPPWVGPGLAERTGLSAERINAVLRGEETQDFCAVRIALIDTLLSRPDEAPEELLRIL